MHEKQNIKIKQHKNNKQISPLCDEQPYDNSPKKHNFKQISCFSVRTNEKTHKIINKNISLSPMFSGKIKGVGPRYCPSIEDKIFRFKKRDAHQLFLEPEWSGADQLYVNGFSTSLPEKAQESAIKTIPGLEKTQFI